MAINPDDVIAVMNDLFRTDRVAMHELAETRVPCNDAMRNHPTAQVVVTEGGKNWIGLIGVLNALCGCDKEGTGFIAGDYDDETGQLVGFTRWKGKKTP